MSAGQSQQGDSAQSNGQQQQSGGAPVQQQAGTKTIFKDWASI